ncbi:MAG: hypothetical protein ACR2LC_00405 [Pyrinomonadaceae bacterium]
MSKTKERGRFHGKVKTVTARSGGRVTGQMPFDQLVNEVADDPNFSLAQHGARRNSPPDSFQEAVSLLSRARRHLAEDGSAQKVKEEINKFLENRVL